MRKLIGLFSMLLVTGLTTAQVVVDQTLTPEEYVNDILLGSGIQASNITFTGSEIQLGHMTGGDGTDFPLDAGIVLSTADAENIELPDGFANVPFGEGVSGDADLLSIANDVPPLIGQNFTVSSVNDLCILEFDFVATGDTMRFNYSFGSDEYLEWVNSTYNDIFAFFLSGPGLSGPYDSPAAFPDGAINIAQLPGTDPALPITISSVNDVTNDEYYIDNFNNNEIAIDGYTVKLEAVAQVECGETYHIKLAIADGSDTALESIVVLEAGSFESNAVVEVDLSIDVGGPDANTIYEDCGEALLTFTRPLETIIDIEEMVLIEYFGTATNGVDFTLLPDSVIFPPFVEQVSFPIDAFEDGIPEGVETVQLEILNLAACNGGGLTTYFEFLIADEPEPLVVDGYTEEMCIGDTVELEPIITGGYGNFVYDWSTNETTPTIWVTPVITTTYSVIVGDTCGMPSDGADITIEVLDLPPLEVTIDNGDLTLSCGDFVTVTATAEGGDGIYDNWYWYDQNGDNLFGWGNTLWYSTWQGANEIYVDVEDGCGFLATDMIEVDLNVPEMFVDIEEEQSVLCNENFVLDPDVTGGEAPYFYNWYVDGAWTDWQETFSYSTSEDVVITFDVQDNCGQSITMDINITVDSPPVEIDMVPEMTGSCIEVFNIIPDITNGSGGYTYNWTDNGDNLGVGSTLNFQSDVTTVIDLEVNDQCGQTGYDQITINIVNPPLIVELGDAIDASCIDNTEIFAEILDGSGGYEYTWIVNNQEEGQGDTFTWQSYETVDVVVEVTDGCDGFDQDTITIIIPDIPLELTLSADTAICLGGAAELFAEAAGGEEGFQYWWTELEQFGQNAGVDPLMTSSYEVSATDICGETITGVITVEVQTINSAYTTDYLNETDVQFTSMEEPECDGCTFIWDFGDGTGSLESDPFHEFDGLDDYPVSLTVVNPIGCTDIAYGSIIAPPLLYIPNAFSPNNDGINDVFQVYGEQLLRYKISIFNRWGELVFESEDVNDVWVGDYQGGDHYVPNGTYTYVVKIKGLNTDAEERSGTVTVLR